VKKELVVVQLQAEQLKNEAIEVPQVRSHNKALMQKAANLVKRIIYLEGQLENERQLKEKQCEEFATKEEMLLA